jgi:hypothetical protein
MGDDPRPAWPDEFGFDKQPAETTDEVEPANMLATSARSRLLSLGFNDTQIVEWAILYVAEHGEDSTPEAFLAWIKATQDARG